MAVSTSDSASNFVSLVFVSVLAFMLNEPFRKVLVHLEVNSHSEAESLELDLADCLGVAAQ